MIPEDKIPLGGTPFADPNIPHFRIEGPINNASFGPLVFHHYLGIAQMPS
jgi:hypothetical protein